MNKIAWIGVIIIVIAIMAGAFYMSQSSSAGGTGNASNNVADIENSLNAIETSELTEPNFSELVPENLS